MMESPGSITDAHVAAARALFADDNADGLEELEKADLSYGNSLLMAGILVELAEWRFQNTEPGLEVVGWVAQTRVTLGDAMDELDPLTAEVMLRSALGESVPGSLDGETASVAQFLVIMALFLEAELDSTGLDLLLHRARTRMDPVGDA